MINILIADDNLYYAKTLMNTINENNENIKVTHIAINGDEILNIIENHPINIILLDLKMPICDGITVIKKIEEKKDEKYKNSIIVISGESELLLKLKDSNCVYDIIHKVCSMTDIINKINELVNEKRREKEYENIKAKIVKEMQYLNYNIAHKGTQYLIEAILIIHNTERLDTFNLKKDIYPILAKRHNVGILNIKTNITKANDYMYKMCEIEKIKKYFYFYDKTKPTAKTVIYTVLNKII